MRTLQYGVNGMKKIIVTYEASLLLKRLLQPMKHPPVVTWNGISLDDRPSTQTTTGPLAAPAGTITSFEEVQLT